ncbi:MAG: LacI family DNA-binding transcriptional regulator [Candidatus Pelethousia sp.]|nr:LacI family DNA-binding transcriptional regulator [Candidatus Pelethousia sp.]
MITIKELADKLGVSTTTISNVIHGKTGEVSQATIEMVQRAVREYNYIPNMSARALAQKSSKIIGVVLKFNPEKELNALQDPFAGELMGALEASIREAGYYMMQYVAPNVGDIVRLMKTWNVEGLILSGFHAQDYKQIRAQTPKPMVFVDCYFGDVGIPYSNIGLEDQTGGRIMTEYLISLGHKRIAFLSDNQIGNDWMRWLGYCEAMEAANLPYSEEKTYIMLRPGWTAYNKSLAPALEPRDRFSALFFASDYYAMRGFDYLYDHGFRIPEDISIAGFDDNILSQNLRPRLTTIHQNPTQKARLAFDMLMRLIAKEDVEGSIIRLPVSLVAGGTTAPPR